MKRVFALFLSAALLLALLCACTGGTDPDTTVIPSDTGESASVPPESTPSQEPSEQPSEKPTEEVTAEPSQEPSQAPATQPPATQPPATQAPATTHHPEESHHVEPTHHPEETHHPAPSPTVPGGGIIFPGGGGNTQEPTDAPSKAPDGFANPTGPSASDVNLTNFSNNVLNGYGFPPMMEPPADFATNLYPGLFTIPVVQRLVITPQMTGSAAEIVLVQVTNSSDVATVKSILQARIDRQANDFNYPQVKDAWQNNSRVVSNGNYVMLIVHEGCDAIVAQFDTLF